MSDITICIKCNENPSTIVNRKEAMCNPCYNRFARGKLRKALSLDIYKVNSKYGIHKILVSYSGSKASLATLDMLYDLMIEQKNRNNGKKGFEIVVVNIDEKERNSLPCSMSSNFETLRTKYEEVLFDVVNINDFLNGKKLIDYGIDKKFNVVIKKSDKLTMDEIFQSIDKSSQEDLTEILYDNILLDVCRAKQCGTIMYCETMNKLASESLSLIIKGRGTKIPEKINDTIIEDIHIIHPIRDLYTKEIEYYNEINEISDLVVESNRVISNINKNMTVKEIVDRYLRNVEQSGYSSTIPTVVKISEKLVAPSKFSGNYTSKCNICGDTIYQDCKTWLSKITVNDSAPLIEDIEFEYLKMFQDQEVNEFDKSVDIPICYGCMVAMNKPVTWPTDQDIINEYSLE